MAKSGDSFLHRIVFSLRKYRRVSLLGISSLACGKEDISGLLVRSGFFLPESCILFSDGRDVLSFESMICVIPSLVRHGLML